MRVLVTRPMPDAEATAAELRRRGHEAVLQPMLDTRLIPPAPADLAGDWAALVLTSLNGLRGLRTAAGWARLRPVPLWCVGTTTAQAAAAAGFHTIAPPAATAADLAARLAPPLRPARWLSAAGMDRTPDLEHAAAALGLDLAVVEVYRAEPVTRLRPEVAAAIAGARIDVVAIYSTRTALAFADAVTGAGLMEAVARAALVAISDAGIAFRTRQTAVAPNGPAMLDAIDALAGG